MARYVSMSSRLKEIESLDEITVSTFDSVGTRELGTIYQKAKTGRLTRFTRSGLFQGAIIV